jgi:hypothetical protein
MACDFAHGPSLQRKIGAAGGDAGDVKRFAVHMPWPFPIRSAQNFCTMFAKPAPTLLAATDLCRQHGLFA